MARWRFLSVALLALALTGNSTPSGRTQVPSATSSRCSERPMLSVNLDKNDRTCVIYSLSERGMDADLGKWIAETIPETIEPGSWKGAGVLRYYAPKNILVVNHSSAVHAKIDRFLQEVKTSLPKGNKSRFATSKKMPNDDVIPASYRQIAGPPEPSAYPVPAPAKAPKHLFHFLIRYEGEGIIDDNVVKYMKVQNQGEKEKTSVAGTASTPVPSPPQGSSAALTSNSPGVEVATPVPSAPVPNRSVR